MRREVQGIVVLAMLFSSSAGAQPEAQSFAAQAREWVQNLSSPEHEVRQEAIERLRGAGEGVVPYLEEGMKCQDPETVMRCGDLKRWFEERKKRVRLLETFHGSEILLDFYPNVTDRTFFNDDPAVRKRVLSDFGTTHLHRTVAWVLSGAGGTAPLGTDELKKLETWKASYLAYVVCEDGDPTIRTAVLETLMLLRNTGMADLAAGLRSRLHSLWKRCAGMDSNKDEQRALLGVLAEIGSPENREALLRALKESPGDPALQWGAGRLKVKEAGSVLVKQLEKEPAEILIWALIEIGERKAVETLEKLLEDRTPLPPAYIELLSAAQKKGLSTQSGGTPVCDRAIEALIRITGQKPEAYVPNLPPPGARDASHASIRAPGNRDFQSRAERNMTKAGLLRAPARPGEKRTAPFEIDFRFGRLEEAARQTGIARWREWNSGPADLEGVVRRLESAGFEDRERASAEIWSVPVGEMRPWGLFLSGNCLVAATHNGTVDKVHPMAPSAVAFDAGTGEFLWDRNLASGFGASVMSSFQVSGGRFYASGHTRIDELTETSWLVCGDAKTGKTVWEHRPDLKKGEKSLYYGPFWMDGEHLLLSGHRKEWDAQTEELERLGRARVRIPARPFLECYRTEDGKRLWRQEELPGPVMTAAMDDGLALVGGPKTGGRGASWRACVEMETGKVLWVKKGKAEADGKPQRMHQQAGTRMYRFGSGKIGCYRMVAKWDETESEEKQSESETQGRKTE